MEDQNLNNEETEVVTQENDPNESQQANSESHDEVSQEKQSWEEKQERNWRAMEQRQKQLELEIQRREELLEKVLKSQQPAVTQVEEEPDDPDDDFVPAGKVRKIAHKQVKPLEQKLQELEAKIAQQEQSKRLESLRVQYSDFDDVVNIETLELLEKTEPELAKTIGANKDPYVIGVQSYKYIKALGLLDQLPNARRKKEVDKIIDKNAKTVQSPTAYEKRPVAQAKRSTEADQKRLYEEMMYYASQASGL